MSKRRYSILRYIGGKYRIAPMLGEYLRSFGRDTLVDVFGGSAAVTLNAGFDKCIYNDLDGDMVNLFRVISDRELRRQLLQLLKALPPSRRIFQDDYREYVKGGFSFAAADPVERARMVVYRSAFCFGGKMKSGGFQVSIESCQIKEVRRYRNILRRIVDVGEFFRGVVIENLHFDHLISNYERHKDCVLFCDPPYDGSENYYSVPFGKADHVFLASQLMHSAAPSVVTYYDTPFIRSLYPESHWDYQFIETHKNSRSIRGGAAKSKAQEMVLVRKFPG